MLSSILLVLMSQYVHAAPMLVTRTTGEVLVENAGKKSAAPKTTFALLDGQTLHVPDGGLATVVAAGKAEQVVGPKQFTTAQSVGSEDVAGQESALSTALSRQNSAANVGATRSANGMMLTTPIPDTFVRTLDGLQWQCTKCPTGKIELVQLDGFTVLWSEDIPSNSRRLSYSGEELTAGEYAIKVDGQYFGFEVLSKEEQHTVSNALAEANTLSTSMSPVDQLSIEVGILWQYGLWSEAFAKIDQALMNSPQDESVKTLKNSYTESVWVIHEE